MVKLSTEFEHDANVAVLAVVVGLAALRRSVSAEAVLRDASRRLLTLRGPAVSRHVVERHVQAAMKRMWIGRQDPSNPDAERSLTL
jgi:hypothetical protein